MIWLTWKTRVSLVVKNFTIRESAPNRLCAVARGIETTGSFSGAFTHQKELFIKALQETRGILQNDSFGESAGEMATAKSAALSNRVFIVHGVDSSLQKELELFLKNVGLEPVALRRESNEGKTIIEKLEKDPDVGYAFVLLTPDEISYTVDEDKVGDDKRKKEFRARPDVIFEFGYFIGKLDRSRVCCILKGDVTEPIDIAGFVYKKVGDGGIDAIAYAIIKELKAAGYILKL